MYIHIYLYLKCKAKYAISKEIYVQLEEYTAVSDREQKCLPVNCLLKKSDIMLNIIIIVNVSCSLSSFRLYRSQKTIYWNFHRCFRDSSSFIDIRVALRRFVNYCSLFINRNLHQFTFVVNNIRSVGIIFDWTLHIELYIIWNILTIILLVYGKFIQNYREIWKYPQ